LMKPRAKVRCFFPRKAVAPPLPPNPPKADADVFTNDLKAMDSRHEGFQEGFGAEEGRRDRALHLRRQLHVDVNAARVQLHTEVVNAVMANQKEAIHSSDALWLALDRVFDHHYGRGTLPTLYLIHPSIHSSNAAASPDKVRRWGGIGPKPFLWADLKSGLDKRGHRHLHGSASETLQLRILETAMIAIHAAVRVVIPPSWGTNSTRRSAGMLPQPATYSPPQREVEVSMLYVHKDESGRRRGNDLMHRLQRRLQRLASSGQEASFNLETVRLWPEAISGIDGELVDEHGIRSFLLRVQLVHLLPRLCGLRTTQQDTLGPDENAWLGLEGAVRRYLGNRASGRRRTVVLVDHLAIEDCVENVNALGGGGMRGTDGSTSSRGDLLIGFALDASTNGVERLLGEVFASVSMGLWAVHDIAPTLPSLPAAMVRSHDDAFQLLCAQVPWCADVVCARECCSPDGLTSNRLPFYVRDGLKHADLLHRFGKILEAAGGQLVEEHLDFHDTDNQHEYFVGDASMDVRDAPGWALFVRTLNQAAVALGSHQFIEAHRQLARAEEWMYEKRSQTTGGRGHVSLWEFRDCTSQGRRGDDSSPSRISDTRELVKEPEPAKQAPEIFFTYGLAWYLWCSLALIVGASFTVGVQQFLQ